MNPQISSVKNRPKTSSSDAGIATVGPRGCTKGAISTRDNVLLQLPGELVDVAGYDGRDVGARRCGDLETEGVCFAG